MVSGIDTLTYSLEMDWALLWVTARFLGHRTTYLRLTLAATIGVLPTLWVLLRQNLYAVPWELGLVWPLAMLAVAFRGLAPRFWVKGYVLFLAMSFLAGGILTAGLTWMHVWIPSLPSLDWLMVVPPLLALGGRWLPQHRVRQLLGRESYGEVTLEIAGRTLTLLAFWDSGNQLTDPRMKRPVVIVERSRAFGWLPDSILDWALAVHQGCPPPTVPAEWQGRVSQVSFRTLTGIGEIAVVTVDRASGRYQGRWYPMVPVVIGISGEPVASDGSYAALATPNSLIRYPNERVGA